MQRGGAAHASRSHRASGRRAARGALRPILVAAVAAWSLARRGREGAAFLPQRAAWLTHGAPSADEAASKARKHAALAAWGSFTADPLQREERRTGIPSAQATSAFHLTKSIVGTGLALPSGVAQLASSGVGDDAALPVALSLLAAVAAAAACTYREVSRCAAETRAATFAEVFERSGAGGAVGAAWAVALNCAGSCVGYAMILGDMAAEGSRLFGVAPVPGMEMPFKLAMIGAVSAGVLWPMCSQLDLRALQGSSVIGVVATAFMATVMAMRLADGAYTAPAGAFATVAPAADPATVMSTVEVAAASTSSDTSPFGVAGAVFTLLSLLINSFVAHQNAPTLRLEGTSDEGQDEPGSFDIIILVGFAVSAGLYAVIMASGYLTFRHDCSGSVLSNYSPEDPLAACARVATAACVVCSFPQMLMGLRDSLRQLLPAEGRDFLTTPAVLLAAVALLAGVANDLATVLALQGAIFGVLVAFVMPAMMVASNSQRSARW